MSDLPETSETQLWIIHIRLKGRYGRRIGVQLANSEIRLHPAVRETASCPTLYWQMDGCSFVIFRTGNNNYRWQFFNPYNQLGTGISEYDNFTECVVSLLQGRVDHAAREKGACLKTIADRNQPPNP